MSVAWSGNFSFGYYGRLLEAARARFEIRRLGDGLHARTGALLFIRHDIDVSIDRAVRMAEVEADHGVASSYMFVPDSSMYDVRIQAAQLTRIVSLGHEVGLHFDVGAHRRTPNTSLADVSRDIDTQCAVLTEIIGQDVRSVSFHRPLPQFLAGELQINGRINAYARELMQCYLSDSRGTWRGGEPVPVLASTAAPVVQLLVHPIWWGVGHRPSAEQIEDFLVERTAGLAPEARAAFDAELTLTLPGVRRLNDTGA